MFRDPKGRTARASIVYSSNLDAIWPGVCFHVKNRFRKVKQTRSTHRHISWMSPILRGQYDRCNGKAALFLSRWPWHGCSFPYCGGSPRSLKLTIRSSRDNIALLFHPMPIPCLQNRELGCFRMSDAHAISSSSGFQACARGQRSGLLKPSAYDTPRLCSPLATEPQHWHRVIRSTSSVSISPVSWLPLTVVLSILALLLGLNEPRCT